MKLYITDEGDPSVGIFACTYVIDAPFNAEDLNDKEDMEWFRKQMLNAYNEFAEGRLTALYETESHNEDPLFGL